MNSKYTKIKNFWKNKQILNEADMYWKQSHGCFPSVGEFALFVNEQFGINLSEDSVPNETQKITDTDITKFTNKIVKLWEDAADRFAAMTDEQFNDWVRNNSGAEQRARELRAEGQARRTGGTTTTEQPRQRPEPQPPREPRARAEWERARQEELRRAHAEQARQQWAHNRTGGTTTTEQPRQRPEPQPPREPRARAEWERARTKST